MSKTKLHATVRTVALLGLLTLTLALILPSSGLGAKQSVASKAKVNASCQLQVFSWWTGGGEAAGLAKLIHIWNTTKTLGGGTPKCPFVNETVAGGAGENAKAVLAERLANHQPPDSFQGHAGKELLDYIKAGQIVPIDGIYKTAGFKKVMAPQLINQITYKGHLYSVPVNIHRANVLWYNPKILKAAGITIKAGSAVTWAQWITDMKKIKAHYGSSVTPLSLGEGFTEEQLMETTILGALGPANYAKLWTKSGGSLWKGAQMTAALNRFKQLLTYTNSDAVSLTWQEAGKLVIDGTAAFNVMGDWQDGYFSGTLAQGNLHKKPLVDYSWTATPGTSGVFDWLSDSFTLPKGAPHATAAKKWLTFLGSEKAQDTFNPVKGSIPARQDAKASLYDTYLKWSLKQWKADKLACSLTHGCAASNAWNTAALNAVGLFMADKNVSELHASLVSAWTKNSALL